MYLNKVVILFKLYCQLQENFDETIQLRIAAIPKQKGRKTGIIGVPRISVLL